MINNNLVALKALMLLTFMVSSGSGNANTNDQYSLNINLSGTVVANGYCTFNQGGELNVSFGEVKLKSTGAGTALLDGNYFRQLTSDFSCNGDTAGLLQMEFTSASGSYQIYNGINVLETNQNVVGIQLLVNGMPQTMGSWFNIDQKNPPSLQVQLIQLTTATNVVSGDEFTASGTLTMAFN